MKEEQRKAMHDILDGFWNNVYYLSSNYLICSHVTSVRSGLMLSHAAISGLKPPRLKLPDLINYALFSILQQISHRRSLARRSLCYRHLL